MHVQHQKPGARVYVVGTKALENEFRVRGRVITDEIPDFVVLRFDTTLTYDKLWKLCNLVHTGVHYIATHPDYNCPIENGLTPDIGAMISFVKESTGREPDLVAGKPNSLFVEQAADCTGIQVSAMCMIGDRLYTDIASAPLRRSLRSLYLAVKHARRNWQVRHSNRPAFSKTSGQLLNT